MVKMLLLKAVQDGKGALVVETLSVGAGSQYTIIVGWRRFSRS